LAEESEEGAGEGRPWTDRLRERMPEAGVAFFGTFIVALVVGFLLAVTGHDGLAVIAFAAAVASVLATLLWPSPAALERRIALETPPDEDEREEDVEGTGEREGGEAVAGPELEVDGAPAPTSRGRAVPTPPPEPPPMEDVVVDLEDGDEADGAPAGEGDDDVWVE
jgi:hypothetical protein